MCFIAWNDAGMLLANNGMFIPSAVGSGMIFPWLIVAPGDTVCVALEISPANSGHTGVTCEFNNITRGTSYEDSTMFPQRLSGRGAVWGISGGGGAVWLLGRFSSVFFDEAIYGTKNAAGRAQFAGAPDQYSSAVATEMSGPYRSNAAASAPVLIPPDDIVTATFPGLHLPPPTYYTQYGAAYAAPPWHLPGGYVPWVVRCDYSGPGPGLVPNFYALDPPPLGLPLGPQDVPRF
jgi:hypothetical protein